MTSLMISVVMPAHNEEGFLESAVKEVVAGLRDRSVPFELIMVENGSTDGTERRSRPSRPYLPGSSGPGYAGRRLRAGPAHRLPPAGGDVVVNLDVDLVDLGFIDRALVELTDDSVVAVIGSKRIAGAADQRGQGRKLVTAVFGVLLEVGFGLQISDTHGLKALRRIPLTPLVRACRFGKDIFDTELLLRAERAGLRLREIPVSVVNQRPPRTSIASRIPRTLFGLGRLRWALWWERPRRRF